MHWKSVQRLQRRERFAPAARFTTILLTTVMSAPLAIAQSQVEAGDSPTDPTNGESPTLAESGDEWTLSVNTWIWFMGVSGDVGKGPLEANIDADFMDIVDDSDSIAAFSGRIELRRGQIAGYVDAFYADIGSDNESGPAGLADVDVTMQQSIVDFGLMYRVAEWAPPESAGPDSENATLDLLAGGRYSYLDVELDPALVAKRSGNKDWVDPIVGAKLMLPFAERWRFIASGDVGGFGAASDLTWGATAVLGHNGRLFGHPTLFMFGYRAIGWDYTTGSGTDRFKWDVIEHGPIFGLAFIF